MTLLYEVRDLRHDYPLGSQRVAALRGIDLAVDTAEFVCLAGPSGSGKSTFLHLLGLIEPVTHGAIRFLGRDLAGLAEAARNRLRRFELGFVFQQFHLLPVLSAYENVEYFLARQRLPRRERHQRVRAALEAVGLWDERERRPHALSGGQRQRVAIARALAKRPRAILADEPTASLDQATGRRAVELLRDLNREQGVTLLLASHDPMVLGLADRVVRLVDGRVVADGATAPAVPADAGKGG